MKHYLIPGLLSLVMLSAANVRAEDASSIRPEHYRLYEFNFSCEFGRQSVADAQDDVDASRRSCTADATVFAYVNPNDWMTALQSAGGNIVNQLAVKCRDRLEFAGDAFLETNHRDVKIVAANGSSAVVVKRRRHQDVSVQNSSYQAALFVDHHWIRGNCEVRNHPVRHLE